MNSNDRVGTGLLLKKAVSDMNHVVDAVVVEGEKDKKSLRHLGFEKPVIQCSSLDMLGVFDRILKDEKIKTITILTDYDRRGKELAKEVSRFAHAHGIKTENLYRRRIGKILASSGITTVESAASVLRKQDGFNGRKKTGKGKGCEAQAFREKGCKGRQH